MKLAAVIQQKLANQKINRIKINRICRFESVILPTSRPLKNITHRSLHTQGCTGVCSCAGSLSFRDITCESSDIILLTCDHFPHSSGDGKRSAKHYG